MTTVRHPELFFCSMDPFSHVCHRKAITKNHQLSHAPPKDQRNEFARFLPKRVPGATARTPEGDNKNLPDGLVVADDFLLVPELELKNGERFVLQIVGKG